MRIQGYACGVLSNHRQKTLLSLRIEDRLIPFSLQLLLSASFFLSYSFILFLPTPVGIYFCGPFYNTKLRGLSPRENYTDRAAAAGRRS